MVLEDKLKEPISRRDFIKKTVKVAGVVSLAAMLPSFLAGCIGNDTNNNPSSATGPSVVSFDAYSTTEDPDADDNDLIKINIVLADRSHNITSAKYEIYRDGKLEQSKDIPINVKKIEYEGTIYYRTNVYADIKPFDFENKDYVINILVKNSAGKTTKISFDDNILNWTYEDEPLSIENYCARENGDKNSKNAFLSVFTEIPGRDMHPDYLNIKYQLYLKDKLLTEGTKVYPFFKSMEKLDVGTAYDLVLNLDGDDYDFGKVNGKLKLTFTPEDLS